MCKLKHLRATVVALAFGTLSLFSCSEKSPTSASAGNQSKETGSVIVTLPDLSSSLKKAGASLDTNALTLLITAPDMDTIKYSWPVFDLRGQQVKIDGIPSGNSRFFSGYLTNKSGILTHSGKVEAQIISGATVKVYLKLSGVGSADVCIEVEGYPSACSSQPDTIVVDNCIKVQTAQGSFDGKINATVYGDYTIFGNLYFLQNYDTTYYNNNDTAHYNIYDTNYYNIIKLVESNTSNNIKNIKAIAYDHSAGEYYLIDFSIDLKSMRVLSGYINGDKNDTNEIFAKFYGVDCGGSPQDTFSLYNCLSISTQYFTGEGNVSLYYAGNYLIKGDLTFADSSVKTGYQLQKLVQVTETVNEKYLEIIAFNMSSGTYHYLELHINMNTMKVSYGYIHSDTYKNSEVITKFYAIECGGAPQDTLVVNNCLASPLSSVRIHGNISLIMYNNTPAYGGLTVMNSNDTSVYAYQKDMKVTDYSSVKLCETIVMDKGTGKFHFLRFELDMKSMMITKLSLYSTESQSSPVIASLYGVDCSGVTSVLR